MADFILGAAWLLVAALFTLTLLLLLAGCWYHGGRALTAWLRKYRPR